MEKISIFKTKKIFLPLKSDSYNVNIWYNDDGERYIFKYHKNKNENLYAYINEIFISYLAKQLNIPCQQTFFGSFYGTKGVVAKSFLKENEEEISFDKIYNIYMLPKLNTIVGETFFDDVIFPRLKYEESTMSKKAWQQLPPVKPNDFASQLNYLMDCHLKNRKTLLKIHNHIEDNIEKIKELYNEHNSSLNDKNILDLTYMYAKENNLKLDNHFKIHLFNIMLFDFVVNQDDRHIHNFSLIKIGNNLKLAPIYDNGHCLAFDSQIARIPKHQITLTNCFFDELSRNDNILRTLFHLRKLLEKPDFFIKAFKEVNSQDIINILPNSIKDKEQYIDNYLNTSVIIMSARIKDLDKKIQIYNSLEK